MFYAFIFSIANNTSSKKTSECPTKCII